MQLTGQSGASDGEQIAAAFVFDRMEFIPKVYNIIEAWERLDNWQQFVKRIKRDHMHLIESQSARLRVWRRLCCFVSLFS